MLKKAITLGIFLCLCTTALVAFTGCEGASRADAEIREKLDAKLTEWNANGGFPTTEVDVDTTGYLKEWRFKYNRLYLVFNGMKAHPVSSRAVLEGIGVAWYGTYPENIKPRFQLLIYAYKDMESHDAEWGMTKILRDGTPETHWYATDVY